MHGYLLALTLARALDTGTSCAAFQRPGLTEGNPLLPRNCAAVVAIEGGFTVGQDVSLHRAARRHPTLAAWAGWTTAALEGAVVVLNVRHLTAQGGRP